MYTTSPAFFLRHTAATPHAFRGARGPFGPDLAEAYAEAGLVYISLELIGVHSARRDHSEENRSEETFSSAYFEWMEINMHGYSPLMCVYFKDRKAGEAGRRAER
jgi:hypothetical protein